MDDSLDLLVDELGGIRARITALKAQEAAIRADILARVVPERASRDVAGHGFTLRIVQSERRRIDTKALPADILGNPAYFKTTTSVRLTTTAL
ncbi:MAG: hypothetical protein AAFY38_07750 [Pseudomonadota bacterium]